MKICLMIIDCLRPDHLGCYGYLKNTSPNIDTIADQGIVFENTFAQSNWTYPSVNSMMTSKFPSTLKI
ncbi:MAG: sulfatase, partial [Candidatus Electrothrix sp. MAN1_4]|nr:sulfatase [Candidatus Electrothrix sp. MAN1_4]